MSAGPGLGCGAIEARRDGQTGWCVPAAEPGPATQARAGVLTQAGVLCKAQPRGVEPLPAGGFRRGATGSPRALPERRPEVMTSADNPFRRATVRHEFKYVLRPDAARNAIGSVQPFLEKDPYCARNPTGTYTVRSIYFDSPGLECFHNKCSGQFYREKYRLRTYDGPDRAPLFIEVKRKRGLDYLKRKVRLDRRDLDLLANRDFPGFERLAGDARSRRTVHRIFYQIYRKAYGPVLLVIYEREAYIGAADDTVRITLDRNLRVRAFPTLDDLYEERGVEYPIGEWVIMEVKFTRTVPRWMRSLNTVYQLKPQACSKYCTGVAHVFGENPRVRRGFRHF